MVLELTNVAPELLNQLEIEPTFSTSLKKRTSRDTRASRIRLRMRTNIRIRIILLVLEGLSSLLYCKSCGDNVTHSKPHQFIYLCIDASFFFQTKFCFELVDFYRKQEDVSDWEGSYDIRYEPRPQVADSDPLDIQNRLLRTRRVQLIHNGWSP